MNQLIKIFTHIDISLKLESEIKNLPNEKKRKQRRLFSDIIIN